MNKKELKRECSNCGYSDYSVFVKYTTRGQETIIKCLKCNHEKVEYITTVGSNLPKIQFNSSIMNYKHNGIEYF